MPFSFLNSALLAAGAAAAIPFLIHLLHKRKAREDALPTLKFLAAGLAANRKRLRMKNFLVLALRVSAVLLIVATLARPAYLGTLFFREGTAPVNAVIVIDNSVSMAYENAGARRFDRAKSLAREVLSTLAPGSRAALVVTGLGAKGESLDREFTFNRNQVAKAVANLDVSAYGGDSSQALARAYAALAQEKATGGLEAGREVYIISDLMRHSWGALESVKPSENTATVVLDAGADGDENFHVDEAASLWLTAPSPHVALKSLVSSGDLAATRLVEAYLADTKRAERIVELGRRAKAPEDFDVPVLAPLAGALQGWVALSNPDPIRADNVRYFTVSASRPVQCVIIGQADGTSDTGFFLRNALEPRTLAGSTGIRVRYEDIGAWKPSSLEGADVAVVADVKALAPPSWDALEQFASGGKGLVIFAGGRAQANDYDPFLRKYFGARLGEVRSAGGETYVNLAVLSFDHPMLAAFAGGQNGNLSAARMARWRRLVPTSGGRVKAVELARIAGDPGILAAPVGTGRAVVAAFSPTREATDLVLRAPFVPFACETVWYASGGAGAGGIRSGVTDFLVGAGISFGVKRSSENTRAEIVTPLGGKPVEVSIPPGTASFVYRPFFPGNYRARIPGEAGTAEVGFSVNIAPSESVLERVPAKEIMDALPGSIVSKEVSGRPIARALGKTRGAREIFDVFLVAAIVVLAVEEYVANRFYRDAAAGGA